MVSAAINSCLGSWLASSVLGVRATVMIGFRNAYLLIRPRHWHSFNFLIGIPTGSSAGAAHPDNSSGPDVPLNLLHLHLFSRVTRPAAIARSQTHCAIRQQPLPALLRICFCATTPLRRVVALPGPEAWLVWDQPPTVSTAPGARGRLAPPSSRPAPARADNKLAAAAPYRI